MKIAEAKNTWSGTSGLSNAAQVVNEIPSRFVAAANTPTSVREHARVVSVRPPPSEISFAVGERVKHIRRQRRHKKAPASTRTRK